jgi:hypothetical protein
VEAAELEGRVRRALQRKDEEMARLAERLAALTRDISLANEEVVETASPSRGERW